MERCFQCLRPPPPLCQGNEVVDIDFNVGEWSGLNVWLVERSEREVREVLRAGGMMKVYASLLGYGEELEI